MALVPLNRSIQIDPIFPNPSGGTPGARVTVVKNGWRWEKGTRPKVLKPLQYASYRHRVFDYAVSLGPSYPLHADNWWTNENQYADLSTARSRHPWVYEVARARLLDKLRGEAWNLSSEWLTSLAEVRDTYRMIQSKTDKLNKLNDLDGAVREAKQESRRKAVKRLIKELRANARGRGLPTPSPLRTAQLLNRVVRTGKGLGSIWLEYWMGWAPLCGDIQAGLQRLGTQEGRVMKASAASRHLISGEMSRIPSRHGSQYGYSYSYAGWYRVKIGCDVRSVDPNKLLLRDLGLTNPWKTLHDIVPWSWLLSWGHNLSAVLGQWDDLYGFDLDTSSIYVTYQIMTVASQREWAPFVVVPQRYDRSRSIQRYALRREIGALPQVKFRVRTPGYRPERVFTIVSLFFQNLRRNSDQNFTLFGVGV